MGHFLSILTMPVLEHIQASFSSGVHIQLVNGRLAWFCFFIYVFGLARGDQPNILDIWGQK